MGSFGWFVLCPCAVASGAAWGRPAGVSFPWEKLPLLLDVARSEGRALVEPKFLSVHGCVTYGARTERAVRSR